MEKLLTYRESSRGFRREITLHPNKVVIVGRGKGKEFEHHISLQELWPEFSWFRYPNRRGALGIVVIATVVAIIYAALAINQYPIDSPASLTVAGFVALILVIAMFCLPKTTIYQFLNESGNQIVNVYDSGPDKSRCREFVEEIATAIVAAQARDSALDRPEPSLESEKQD